MSNMYFTLAMNKIVLGIVWIKMYEAGFDNN